MAAKFFILALFFLSLGGLIILYARKLALHFQYLRVKDGRKAGELSDFFYRHFTDKKDPERWKNAWMIYPLLFPVDLEDEKGDRLVIKKKIKQANVLVYVVLIVALRDVVYAAKAFPEGLF